MKRFLVGAVVLAVSLAGAPPAVAQPKEQGKPAQSAMFAGHRDSDVGPSAEAARFAPGRETSSESSTKRRTSGVLLWEDRYDGGGGFSQAFMTAAGNGRAFAVGFVAPAGPRDAVTRAYDGKTGTLLWQDQVNRGSDDFASGVVTDGEHVFVSGTSRLPGRNYDWTLRAYDAETGAVQWDSTWDFAGGSDFSRGTALALSGGRVFLGGYGTDATGDAHWVLRAYDAATGALLWQDVRNDVGHFDIAYTVAAAAGRVFAGGSVHEGEAGRAVVRGFDAMTGTLLWEQRGPEGVEGITFTNRVKVDSGRVFASRNLFDLETNAAAPEAVAYQASDGALLWHAALGTGENQWVDDLGAADGRVVATGFGGEQCLLQPSPPSDCAAVIHAYDAATGATTWVQELQMSGVDDGATMVAIDAGKVFVLTQLNSTELIPGCCVVGQWVMQAFNGSTGTLLWRSVGRELESGVYNMVVDKGILFAPGRSIDPNTGDWDLLMRAYDTRGKGGTIEPLPFVPLPEIIGTGTSGQASFEVQSEEPVTASPYGLIPAATQAGNVVDDPTNNASNALNTGVGATFHTVSVPAGSRHLRVQLFDSETDGNDDLDLYLFDPDGNFVDASGGATAEEKNDVHSPVAGDYTLMVHGFETDGPDANYTLFTWALDNTAAGNLTVSGPPPGGSGTVTVSWSGLTSGLRYLGDIGFDGTGGEVAHTLVSVNA